MVSFLPDHHQETVYNYDRPEPPAIAKPPRFVKHELIIKTKMVWSLSVFLLLNITLYLKYIALTIQ